MVVTTRGKKGSATGISWVETRDAAKRPSRHRTAPTTRNYPALKVSGAMV